MKKPLILAVALCFVIGAGYAKADEKRAERKAKKADAAEKQDAKDEARDKTEEAKGEKAEKGEKEATAGSVTCKLGKEVRTLEKKDAEGGGCEVIYTKGGEGKSIANAKNDLSYCDKMIDKLKEKLTAGGYECE